MGGYGSGRSAESSTVEEYLRLDINELVRRGKLCRGYAGGGTLMWTRTIDGKIIGVCQYGYDLLGESKSLMVEYHLVRGDETIRSKIDIDAVPAPFGGKRLFFICPGCGNRRWHLYLGRGVLCRGCLSLTYQSCQDSHKYDGLYGMIARETGRTVAEVRRALRAPRNRR